jgi:hypothetical protein
MHRWSVFLLFEACLRWFAVVVVLNRIGKSAGDEPAEIEQKETKETKNSKGSSQ